MYFYIVRERDAVLRIVKISARQGVKFYHLSFFLIASPIQGVREILADPFNNTCFYSFLFSLQISLEETVGV